MEEAFLTARQWLEYGFVRLAMTLLKLMPGSWARGLAATAARALYRLGGKRVGYVETNLRFAFPDLGAAQRSRIGRESYVNLAWNAVDVARAEFWTGPELLERVELVGLEHVEAALARGHGILAFPPHLGSFEIGLRAAAAAGLPVTVVGRPLRNPKVRARVNRTRTSTGAELIEHRNVAPRMLRALRSGRLVVAMIDQYATRSRGIMVPLFGLRCSTSPGPATLALRSGAALMPAYALRLGPERHRITFLPPLELERTGDQGKDVERGTAACNAALEAIIRRHPGQWMWSHRRFRHSPDLSEESY